MRALGLGDPEGDHTSDAMLGTSTIRNASLGKAAGGCSWGCRGLGLLWPGCAYCACSAPPPTPHSPFSRQTPESQWGFLLAAWPVRLWPGRGNKSQRVLTV